LENICIFVITNINMFMENVIVFLKKYKLTLIGGVLGATGGFLYWYFIGCNSGTCPITSSPFMSTLWGVLIGGSLFNIFEDKKKQEEENK